MFMAVFPPLVLGYAKRLQSGHRARFRAEHDVAMCCQVILVGPLVLRFSEPRQHIIDIWQFRHGTVSFPLSGFCVDPGRFSKGLQSPLRWTCLSLSRVKTASSALLFRMLPQAS